MKRMKKRIIIAVMGLAAGILGIGWGLIGHEGAKNEKLNKLREASHKEKVIEQEKDIMDLMGKHYT